MHQHAAARQVGIPLEEILLTVLQQEELFVYRCIDTIARLGAHRIERVEYCGAGSRDYHRLVHKADSTALIERVAHRGAVVVGIASLCHHRPVAGMIALSPTLLIVGIVEVGQSEHMTELMTDGADAVEFDGLRLLAVAIELNGAGIVEGIDAIYLHTGKMAVGPDEPFVIAGEVGPHSGKDHIYKVYPAVAVTIIACIVDIGIGSLDGSPHQLIASFGTLGIVLAIVQRIRPHHIELRLEAAIGIVGEIVAQTACKHLAAISREPLLVGHLVHQFVIVGARKLQIVVLREDNQPAKAMVVEARGASIRGRCTTGRCLLSHSLNLRTHGRLQSSRRLCEECLLAVTALPFVVRHLTGRQQLTVLKGGIDIIPFSVLNQGIPVGGGMIVNPLVAAETDGDKGAVRLLHPTQPAMGRHRPQLDSKQDGRQKNTGP